MRTGTREAIDITADIDGLGADAERGKTAGAGAIGSQANRRGAGLATRARSINTDRQAAAVTRASAEQREAAAIAGGIAGHTANARVQTLREPIVGGGIGQAQGLACDITDMAIGKHHRLRRVRAGTRQTEHITTHIDSLGAEGGETKLTGAGAVRGKGNGCGAGLVAGARSIETNSKAAVIGRAGSEHRKTTVIAGGITGDATDGRIETLGETIVRHIVAERQILAHHITDPAITEVDRLWGVGGRVRVTKHRAADREHLLGDVIEVVDHRHRLAAQGARAAAGQEHIKIAARAVRIYRAEIGRRHTTARQTCISDIAAVDRGLQRAAQSRTAGAGIGNRELPLGDVADMNVAEGDTRGVRRTHIDSAGQSLPDIAAREDLARAGDVGACVEAVADTKIVVGVVHRHRHIRSAERQRAVVDETIAIAVGAQYQGRTGVGLDGAALAIDAITRGECAAARTHRAGVDNGRGDGAKAEDLASASVGQTRCVKSAATELQHAAVVERADCGEVTIAEQAECALVVGQGVDTRKTRVGAIERDVALVGSEIDRAEFVELQHAVTTHTPGAAGEGAAGLLHDIAGGGESTVLHIDGAQVVELGTDGEGGRGGLAIGAGRGVDEDATAETRVDEGRH